jgi:hypothetical protein
MHRGIACLNRKFIFVSKNALFTGRFLNNPARIAYIEYMKKRNGLATLPASTLKTARFAGYERHDDTYVFHLRHFRRRQQRDQGNEYLHVSERAGSKRLFQRRLLVRGS